MSSFKKFKQYGKSQKRNNFPKYWLLTFGEQNA